MGEMLLNGRLYGASGIRELTQAQYDALPASKLTDGILYCIKDTGIVEGDKYAPIIYSLEEQEVGVWTDGKPLYEKTLTVASNASINNNQWTAISWNNTPTNIEKLLGCEIHLYGTEYVVPNPYVNLRFRYINDAICCASGISATLYAGSIITFKYTKTTDIPGSGTWGTDGVPMVHYDGNEKVIGTWFGETLYEKTVTIPISSQTGDTVYTVDSGLSVVNAFGIIKTTSGFKMVLPASYSNIFYCGLQHDSNNIRLSIYSSSSWQQYNTLTETTVTIQYTKTS